MNVKLCPGVRVNGRGRPSTENPVPFVASFEMVIFPLFALLNVTNTFEVFPVCTFPKYTLDGFGISDFAVVADPRRVSSGLPLNAMLPLSDPEAVGPKVTVRTKLCPGAKLSGSAGRLTM